MNLAALYSGGKDSSLAVQRVLEDGHKVTVLVSISPKSPESYMFHFPNITLTELQARAASVPLIKRTSDSVKEEEVRDIEEALKSIRGIEGVVVGAIASEYQRKRVQAVCDNLDLEMVAPLWGIDSRQLWIELLAKRFSVMIVGVACDGLGKEWLGRIIDEKSLSELDALSKKHRFHLAGEGGEFETLTLDAPFFRKRLAVKKSIIEWNDDSGYLHIDEAVLEDKQ